MKLTIEKLGDEFVGTFEGTPLIAKGSSWEDLSNELNLAAFGLIDAVDTADISEEKINKEFSSVYELKSRLLDSIRMLLDLNK